MKNRNKLLLMLLVIIPMFVSVVFAIWYISDFKMASPDFKLNDVLTKYIDDQETTYDGNYQLPAPEVFENSISLNTKDITYYFKLNGSNDGYVLCEENKIGPKNAGIYDIKVIYDLSYTDIDGNNISNTYEKVITFTINKYKYNIEGISFTDTSKVYNGETQTIEITGTLPDGLTVTYDGGGKDVTSSPYIVTANFKTPDEINYEQIDSITANLTITPLDISNENIFISFVDNKDTYAYLETAVTPSIKILFNETELKLNIDFSVKHIDNTLDSVTARKTSTAIITGMGNFTGTKNINYDIVRYMYLWDDKSSMQSFTYDGTVKYPKVILYSDDSYKNKITDSELNSLIFTYNANYKDSIIYYNYENQTNISSYEINVSATLIGYELFESINVKYYITQKEIEKIEWSSQTTFTYNGSYQSPTATAKGIIDGDICNVNITVGGTNAGSYTVQINSDKPLSNLNYKIPSDLTNTICSYKINKATIQGFDDTISLTGEYIEGDEPVISKTTGYTLIGITTPEGEQEKIKTAEISNVNYSNAKFIDSLSTETQQTSLVITFKTNDPNYEDYVYTASINIYAVATIGSLYYGTVERALEAANSGNEVFLIPKRNPTIRKNVEIKSGVTLYIVYAKGQWNGNKESINTGFNNTSLKNTLNIASNVIVTNYGIIKIDGVVGNHGSIYAGQTSEYYTQILMDNDSKINSYNTIECLGYIKETYKDNGSQVNINKGTISAPLVIYDFKGGTNSSYLYLNSIWPCKIYDVPNVQPIITISSSGAYKVFTSLYMNNEYNHSDNIYVVGNSTTDSNSTLFIIKSGSITFKYNYNSNDGVNYNNNNTTNYYNSDFTININGDCESGNLSLKLSIKTINTEDFLCPIPYKMKIELNSGIFTIKTKLEFLPGSELIVGENGELNINANCVFYESYSDTGGINCYPTSINGNNFSSALLEVNGICNIYSDFAGIITSNSISGQLFIQSNSLSEIYDGNGSGDKYTLGATGDLYYAKCKTKIQENEIELKNAELYAIGYIDSKDNYSKFSNETSYTYDGNCWKPMESKGEYTVNYIYWDENKNDYISEPLSRTYKIFDSTKKILLINNVERNFYTNGDWYVLDDVGNYIVDSDGKKQTYDSITPSNNGNYTIKLSYIPKQYTINYVDINGQEQFNTTTTITYGSYNGISILNPLEIENMSFIGWYLSNNFEINDVPDITPGTSDETILLSIITKMEDDGIDNITLYGKYCVKYEVTLITTTPNGSASETIIYVEDGSTLNSVAEFVDLNNELLAKNTDNSFAYNFKYWNDENDNEYETSEVIKDDFTLKADWTDKKYSLTINYAYDDGNSKESNKYYYNDNQIKLPNIDEQTGYRTEYSYSNIDENGNFSQNQNKASITVNYKKLYKVTITLSNATIDNATLNGSSIELNNGSKLEVIKDDILKFTSNYSKNNDKTTTIDGAKYTQDDNTYTITIGSSDVTINVSSKDSTCLVEGTLISMADGTYKKVEDLKVGDLVKVFNHKTGKIDNSTIIVNVHESETSRLTSIINLVFDNDQITRISFEHGFFDVDLNKYIYINNQNYNSMIGHRFYTIDGSTITLINAYITEEYVKVFSPVTYKHLNIFVDDLLSITGGIYGLFNIFDLNDDMTINIDKFNEDIEKYGLYEYSEWSDYMTLEEFESINFKYFKIAVAKGIITIDELIKIILS